MKTKSLETILFSAVGIIAMALILIAFNVITGTVKTRVDLTKEKAYTLSSGTKTILGKLDTPVKIRFYCTQSKEATPETVYLKNYAKQVEDLLDEYKQAAKGKLTIEKYDPQPDSDAEDSARLDGIQEATLSDGEKFYLGLAVSLLDQKEAIPFLSPDRERLLEYDISRAISRVVTPEKPVIGIMSALPVFGEPANPMMMQMGQQGQPPWTLVSELKQDFDVKRVPMDTDKIDDAIKVLLVIHPRDITDAAQYAIDQFVLRGGKLIAFLDPMSLVDSRGQNPMMGQMGGGASTLDKLLKAWGIQFDTTKVVADMNFRMQLRGQGNTPTEAPAFLSLTTEGINGDDIIANQIDNIWLPLTGAFTGTPAPGLTETVLLRSTTESQLVDGFMANLSGDSIMKDFKPSGISYALAIRLTGKFKTAFPNGKPEEKTDADKKDDEKKDAKPAENKPAGSLKESKGDNTVVLVGDADMLYDRFTLEQMQTPFGVISEQLNGNLNFAQNAVEQLAGDDNLIGVRSRATLNHPFTRVKQIEAAAEEQFTAKIKELQDSRDEAVQRLSTLQQQKNQNQRFILSPEQQAEIENLRKREAQISQQLRGVQKDLHREVTALQTKVEWLNIAAMPLVVSASGIVLAILKRKRTSAK
jgi:gliding motility-associatede transport system auxiliary component